MAVYYRYRSGVETFSVPVPSPSISVADLKRLITTTSRHGHGRTRGRGPREGVALADARTGEEYTDDAALVPRSSTVLVRRVAGPPAETITVAPPSPKTASRDGAPSDPAVRPSSSSAEDDEDRAISAVIDAAQLRWDEGHHHPSRGARRCGGHLGGAHEQLRAAPPPAGYVCHRCHVPGHFIQHCPTNGDPRFDFGKRAPSTAATTTPPAAPAPAWPGPGDDGFPPDLRCKICKKVMADAVVTGRCCFDSFCDACIRGHVAAESACVCGAPARTADLIPNLTLRTTISNILATRAASAGTEKPRSSTGSNTVAAAAAPASQSTAASQDSRSHVTAGDGLEQSDGSASSTSTSTTAVVLPAAREPRTKRKAAEPAGTGGARAGYDHEQHGAYGYGGGPFGPACYDPFFGGMAWAPPDPYMYNGGVPYGGGYPIAPVPAGYHDGRYGRERTADGEDRRHEEPGFKRRCGSRSLVAV